MDTGKQKIINLFNKKVRGRKSNADKANQNHDGKHGHWLETQMGVVHNNKNEADLYGYEMKNDTATKTTFGDWSPDYSLFKKGVDMMTRDLFLQTFGAPNTKKGGRYSWSGKPCPKIDVFNSFGQKLEVDKNKNILVIYSYLKDCRKNKKSIVPTKFQKSPIVIVSWSAQLMKKRVEKFNKSGWFKCVKDRNGIYAKIVFGEPINFNMWVKDVKKGLIFFDSGMYQGNIRPYSQWRANNTYWDKLITSSY